MSDKKVFQLVSSASKGISAEVKEMLDEMYAEILTGKVDFIMAVGDEEGLEPVEFITNLDLAGCNLMLDQIKFQGILGTMGFGE